jgi:beta-lactamase class A
MTSGFEGRGRTARLIGLAAVLLAVCIPAAQSAQYSPRPTANASAQRILEARISELGRAFDGEVGIAVREVEGGWSTSWNGARYFPQQSVSKFWVALTAFSQIDAGTLRPDQSVTIRREDLTLFHQPIAAQIGTNGYTATLDTLIFRALTQSDNTCNDAVLRTAGGPTAVRNMLARHRLDGVRFGPGERLLQSGIAGMQWQPAFSVGRNFESARSAVPAERRRSSFEAYIADPIDGATPDGIVMGLSRLQSGDLLSPRSTQRILTIMSQTRTGPQRLTGGLAPGWSIAHKTGTGQVFGGTQAGYNDIGILTAPDGRHYAVAVMIGRTSVPNITRMGLMQNVTRAVIAYHDNNARSGIGRYRR